MKHNKVKLLAVTLLYVGVAGLKAQTVTDYDGNVYKTVTIGTQIWMAENLRVKHYANGKALQFVTGDSNWDTLDSDNRAYCWYNDNATYTNPYGALYTWSAAMNGAASSSSSPSGIQGLCPTGWHVPSDAEWTTLTDYLGGAGVAGGKLKETGTTHWQEPNLGATNKSGFTALPGGFRYYYGTFDYIGKFGLWWSSTENGISNAWELFLDYGYSNILRSSDDKQYGFSVRCVSNTTVPNSIYDFLNIDKSILYPNPATERLHFKNINYANTTIMIFDLQGKQVLTKQIDSESIDISNLGQGIYVIKLVCPEKIMITKFIKE